MMHASARRPCALAGAAWATLFSGCTFIGDYTDDRVLASSDSPGAGGAAGSTSAASAGGRDGPASSAAGDPSSTSTESSSASGTSGGGGGAGGGGGGGPTPLGFWPDSRTGYCSEYGAERSCSGSLDDPYQTQDGALGFEASTYFEESAFARDSVTALVWMTDVFADVDADDAGIMCSNVDMGDGRVWRLPSARELASLWDAGLVGDVIDDAVFDVVADPTYWATANRVVRFDTTEIFVDESNEASRAVRCVSGARSTAEWFDEGDAFTDGTTGLTWFVQEGEFFSTWSGALQMCADLGDGYRLPSVKEMASLFPHELGEPLPSFVTTQREYWTSTPVAGSPMSVYYLDAGTVELRPDEVDFVKLALCVRGVVR